MSPSANGPLPNSYIDLDTLTRDDFSPYVHANTLVTRTNNATDTPLDLSTPLSRVLFDVQEVDSHIHHLTTRSAIPILEYTRAHHDAAQRILAQIDAERSRLTASYARLEKDVLRRYQDATDARRGAERAWQVVKLGREIQRGLGLARSLETALVDSGLGQPGKANKEDHRAVLHATATILSFYDWMAGPAAPDLARVTIVKTLRGRVVEDHEATVREYARKVVREFSVSSLHGAPFHDAEEARAKFTSAVHILYLLSPVPTIDGQDMSPEDFEPELLLRALQGYLQTAITASSASMARALAALPNLDRTLLEVSARCQSVVALEMLLRDIHPPRHPRLATAQRPDDEDTPTADDNLLRPLLQALDTASLPSYFWRSVASSLAPRVQDILNRGGVSARTLRSNRNKVRDDIRECVLRGSQVASNVVSAKASRGAGPTPIAGNWEREAAVMAGSVTGPLGR